MARAATLTAGPLDWSATAGSNKKTVPPRANDANLRDLNVEMAWSRSTLIAVEQMVLHVFTCHECGTLAETKTQVKKE